MLKKYRGTILYFGIIVFSIIFLWVGNRIAVQGLDLPNIQNMGTPYLAQVRKLTDSKIDSFDLGGNTINTKMIYFDAVVQGGEFKGQTVQALQTIDGMYAIRQHEVQPGDKIILYHVSPEEVGQNVEWLLGDFLRTDKLTLLGCAFMLLLLWFGREKGLNTIISLVFTCLAIFMVFIPSILAGHNIYLSTIIVSVYIVLMTFLLVHGADRKTFAASVGCVGGIIAAGVLTQVMSGILKLTGALDQESVFLLLLNEKRPIDLLAIIFAAIVIGALGAIMDVAMSIASSLEEICQQVERPTFRSILNSGLNIGRDVISTMTNTLILAYIGGSLSVVLLLIAYNGNLLSLLNRELISVEILQAIVGSLGILLTIPVTSVISAYVSTKPDKTPPPPQQLPES